MKIGLSLSRCVRDIADGKVDIEEILVVIARTNFDPLDEKQWASIWRGYGGGTGNLRWSNPEWCGYDDEDEDRIRSICIELQETGKLFQPRKDGGNPRRMHYYWLETILPSEELESNPAAKKAFEQFQLVAGLTNTKLDKEAY